MLFQINCRWVIMPSLFLFNAKRNIFFSFSNFIMWIFFQFTDDSHNCRRGTIFICLFCFHLLRKTKAFIFYFANEMVDLSSHRLSPNYCNCTDKPIQLADPEGIVSSSEIKIRSILILQRGR